MSRLHRFVSVIDEIEILMPAQPVLIFISVVCRPSLRARLMAFLTPGCGGTTRGFGRDYDILTGDAQPEEIPLAVGPGTFEMKAVGFLMLLAGWFLVLAAVVLFPSPGIRAAFVLAGVAVEGLGLFIVFRSHLIPKEDKE